MAAYFSVKNFEQFQHYKHRSPPWIRLYNSLLDDYEFARLQDASKMHLIAIWLLASRYDNRIPFDPHWIATRINASEPVDLAILEVGGFIIVDQGDREAASRMLAECKQVAMPEKSRVEKRREELIVGSEKNEPTVLALEFKPDEKTKKEGLPASKQNGASHTEVADLPKAERYPPQFEAAWGDYRKLCSIDKSEIGSKPNAAALWKKLSQPDRDACWLGVTDYAMWRDGRRGKKGVFTASPKHFERFIKSRYWETFQEEMAE